MTLERLEVRHFRCLSGVALDPHPHWNLFTGPNASGKTSCLEALFFLGRGRSFRGVQNRQLVSFGESGLTTYGAVRTGEQLHRLGAGWSSGELRCRKDGQDLKSSAELAATFPAQVLDPEVHELVSGSPHHRRRFLDWMVFHVEPSFLEDWRRYQGALRQRNQALRERRADLGAWDEALAAAGEALHAARSRSYGPLAEAMVASVRDLTGLEIRFELQPGWQGETLAEALGRGQEADREAGFTHAGPHRAELALRLDGRRAKDRLSRGQEKSVAIGMVLGQILCLADRDLYPALLVDDPAAELDAEHLARLLAALAGLKNQRFLTCLDPDALELPAETLTFHVERGVVAAG